MSKSITRERILKTASELFYKQGYNLTGINEIIERSGIAKATLYSHFKSKDDICLAYLELKDEELLSALANFCESKPKGNKQLVAVLQFVKVLFKQEGFNGCWCFRTVAELPKSNVKLINRIKSSKADLLEYIKTLVARNREDLSKKQSADLARKVYLL